MVGCAWLSDAGHSPEVVPAPPRRDISSAGSALVEAAIANLSLTQKRRLVYRFAQLGGIGSRADFWLNAISTTTLVDEGGSDGKP